MPAMNLHLLLCFVALARLACGSVLSVYSSAVNPAAFSLAASSTEPNSTLSYAWDSGTRPYPGPFGALWLAMLTLPGPDPVWFRASLGAASGALFKLWVEDHFLINAQTAHANFSSVGLYPLSLSPSGSLLRIEYAAVGAGATASLEVGPTQAGPWAPLPAAALSASTLPPAELLYQQQRSEQEAGWGTWDQASMLNHVLLPSGMTIAVSFLDTASHSVTQDVAVSCSPEVRPGYHAARGQYTEIEALALQGGSASVRVQSALTASGDLVITVETLAASARPQDAVLQVSARSLLAFSNCAFEQDAAALNMSCDGNPTTSLRPVAQQQQQQQQHQFTWVGGALSLPLAPVGSSIALTTAPQPMSLAEALAAVAAQRSLLLAQFATYGPALNDTFAGLHTSISWTAIYSHSQGLVNGEFGRADRLYEWDTFLAAALAAYVDPWLAANNIARLAKGAVPAGYVPGYILDQAGEVDNSKPPVAALVLQGVYAAHGQRWLVELVLDALVRWNAWWARERMVQGLVAPGSRLDPALAPIEGTSTHDCLQAAVFETGLDNSPLYAGATYNGSSGLLSQWDVGLHSLYTADALALAALAGAVGRQDLVGDLTTRAAAAVQRLQQELWCPEAAAFLNKDYVTGQWVRTTGPPNLYPALAGAAFSPQQLDAMLVRYYLNASEWCGDVADCAYGLPSISRADPAFQRQDYWEGRVWGPMNWLVAQGLRRHVGGGSALAARAAESLAAQSRNTFLVPWQKWRHVMENYGALDGTGCETSSRANPLYHWGALTALVAVEEAAGGGGATGHVKH